MRHRQTVTGGFTTPQIRRRRTRSCGGTWGSYSTFSTTYTGELTTKDVWDVEVPRFHALLKCGAFLPINPFTIQTITQTRETVADYFFTSGPTSCTSDYTSEIVGSVCDTSLVANMSLSIPDMDPAVIDFLVNSARAKVNSGMVDMLTNLFEARDIPRTFRTSLNGVTDFATRAARKSRSIDEFSKHWLNYRYGWVPLVLTLQDAVKAYESERSGLIREKSISTVPITGSASWTTSDSDSSDSFSESLTGSYTCRGMAYGEIKNSGGKVGVDPLVTAWELIPFSFVIDWFIQVGTWLQSVSPFGVALSLHSGYSLKTDYTHSITKTVSFHDGPAGTKNSGSGTFGTETIKCERYDRFAHNGALPSWNPRLNQVRIVDALALALSSKARVFSLLFRR